VVVAVAALLAVVGVVLIAILSLPPTSMDDPEGNGATIVALATAGFGVIGAIIGAFFAIRSAGNAVDEQAKRRHEQAKLQNRVAAQEALIDQAGLVPPRQPEDPSPG
jgi:hypothetical protein